MVVTRNGISEGALERAIEEFTAVLGSDHVFTGEDARVEDFRDPFQPRSWGGYRASAVVQPETTEEVQSIVKIANQHGIPLWTHSTGKNNGYGGAGPGFDGAVTVSLRRMNKVLEINKEFGLRRGRARRLVQRPLRGLTPAATTSW